MATNPNALKIAHLLRRATFGPRPDEVDAAVRAGYGATLTALLAPKSRDRGAARTPLPSLGPDPITTAPRNPDAATRARLQQQQRQQIDAVAEWWLDRMVQADHQLPEKLTFFWHGHWATAVQKVKSAPAMLAQQQTFARLGRGDFAALVTAMLRDPALVFFLDGQRNTRRAPNENLARELMELFTLGIGAYTEADVKAGARALTGWALDRATMRLRFNPARHDAGRKTILGRTGTFDADGFAAILLAQPANARFLAERLWLRYASGSPIPAATLNRLVAAYRPRRDVTALLRALLSDPEFARTRGQLVKQPVEWVVGAMRQLGIRPGALPATDRQYLLRALGALGQVPLNPPGVGGWPDGRSWLTTAAAQTRLRTADVLARRAGAPALAALTAVPVGQRVDALARLLVVDGFTARTRSVLAPAAGDARRLIALGLASPEYSVM